MDTLIITYLSGEAKEEEIKLLYDWMQEDPANRQYFLEIRDIWLATGGVLASDAKSNEAFSRFRYQVLLKEKKQRFLIWGKWAAAITILAVSGMSFYLMWEKQWPFSETNIPTVELCQSTGNNRKSFVLPDGSVVWLNKHSTLSYPENFGSDERSVELEGEGYFEVVHNDAIPFYVCTQNMKIKVLGTHFDVKNYAEKGITETVLLSGKVEVLLVSGHKTFILSPNERITYDERTQSYSLDEINATEYTVWTQERLVMDNEELGTILRKLSRWYNVEVICQDNVPVHSRYSLTVSDENIEDMMRLLSIVAPIRYTQEKGEITIYRK